MAKESKRMTLKVGSILVVHELWDYNVDGKLHCRGCGPWGYEARGYERWRVE